MTRLGKILFIGSLLICIILCPIFVHEWKEWKALNEETYSLLEETISEEAEIEEKIEMGGIKTVISPDEMSCMIALDENGNVWKWEEGKTQEEAVAITGVENVVQIVDTGYDSVYALTSEGDVYAWGTNRGWLIDPEERETSVVFPEPVKLQGLSNIKSIDATNGRAFAVNDDRQLFVWGLERYKGNMKDSIPSLLEGYQELTDQVEEIYVGAGNFHYFKCKDNQFFSIISVEYISEYLKYLIVPNFRGEPSAADWQNEIRTGNSERMFDIRVEGGFYLVYLYKMGQNDNVALMGADAYTMYVYQNDGTLWYWNSDRITYHDNERAGASKELRDLDYSGFFEEVDIGNVLNMGTDRTEIPTIISIIPGEEGAMFLLENGQVLVSGYVTEEIKDVEYFGRNASNPQDTWTDVIHNFATKKISFRKLDFENIVNISSNKKDKFFLVDKAGNIYCYQMGVEYKDYGMQTEEKVPVDVETDPEVKKCMKAYDDFILKEDVKRAALIHLDEDDIPELLVLKNGEYRLYSFDGMQITAIDMPDAEIKANAYGPKHFMEKYSRDFTLYWFEYVPYQGLIRVHGNGNEERSDYYLKYEDGSFVLVLEAKFTDTIWHTCDEKQEIDNEEFLSRLSSLGYDKLIPCAYLYENIADAHENIGRTSNAREVLDDFINGNTDALYSVEEINDIPEESFVMKSYEDLYNNFIMRDAIGSTEYVDFDNDGEEELVMRDYMGNCAFFDVIGDTVYNVIETYGTADIAYVAELEGKRVIARTDLTHGGRKCYEIMQYDACGCLVDDFALCAFYEESSYSAGDEFMYRGQEITMEEFEEIENSIKEIPSE